MKKIIITLSLIALTTTTQAKSNQECRELYKNIIKETMYNCYVKLDDRYGMCGYIIEELTIESHKKCKSPKLWRERKKEMGMK